MRTFLEPVMQMHFVILLLDYVCIWYSIVMFWLMHIVNKLWQSIQGIGYKRLLSALEMTRSFSGIVVGSVKLHL